VINKLKTTQYYLSDRIEKHSEVKLPLLDLIDQTTDGEYSFEGADRIDNISKYDFEKHGDMERPWVKFLLPYLLPKLINFVTEFGGHGLFLKALWFQQYKPGDIHDWHIHGENYTGVYYLELPDDAPRTKIYNGEQMIVPEVKEGDLCTFPSMLPHIAMENESLARKTIISYNYNISELNIGTLNKMKRIDDAERR